ncbi:MAG: PaeR7I family type II restriction endonuclease [Terrimicrobiaceae bacterium]
MPPALIDFKERLSQATRAFWRGRRDAVKKQQASGRLDQGNRGAVTGGKNMDGFRDMVVDVVHRYGPEGCEVHRGKTMVVLPGFFRPTKQWDILVVYRERLLAAMELKSLCGPSFGNNANNRCEEAMGSGYDFRKAQGEGLFGPGASPFLGYFLLVEDEPRSRQPVSAKSPHFPTDKVFHCSSYQQRMKILCERMVEQQLYSCASVLVAPNDPKSGTSSHLSNQTAFRFLLSRLAGHLASEADLEGSGNRLNDAPDLYESGSLLAGEWFTSIESSEDFQE